MHTLYSLLVSVFFFTVFTTSAQRFDWVSFTPSVGGGGGECITQDDAGFIYTANQCGETITVGTELITGGGFGFLNMILIKWNQEGEPVDHALLTGPGFGSIKDMAFDVVNQHIILTAHLGSPMSVNGSGAFVIGLEPILRFTTDLEFVSSVSQGNTYNSPVVSRDGYAYVANGYNSIIRRYDVDNNATWSVSNTAGSFNISSLALNADNLLYAIGFFMNQDAVTYGGQTMTPPPGGNTSDVGILVLDTQGNVLDAQYLARSHGYGSPVRIATDNQGFIYVACPNTPGEQPLGPFTIGPSTGANDVFVAKLTADLEVVWVTELHHTGGNMESRVLAVHPDGKVMVSGLYGGVGTMGDFTLPSNGFGLGYIAQLDGESGEVLYATHYGSFAGTSRPFDATIIDDKYFLTGLLFGCLDGQAAFGCYDDCQQFNFHTCFNDVPFELPSVALSFSAPVLSATSNVSDAVYTWWLDGEVIEGETGSSITLAGNGEYEVSVESFGCTSSSSMIISSIGISEWVTGDFVVYPNPTNDVFFIRSALGSYAPVEVVVSNAMGQVVFRDSSLGMLQPIDLRGAAQGCYHVRIGATESRIVVKN